MEPFQPPPRRESQPGVDGWGGVSDQPYINVVRLDTGGGGGGGGPQGSQQRPPAYRPPPQQQQQRRGEQQHRQTARSPQPKRREPTARSPQQQRSGQGGGGGGQGARPTPGHKSPPRYNQGSVKVVPNAVFSQSAADVPQHSKPAVKIVPNDVFEGSRNLQLDSDGRGVRVESTRRSNPIHPHYTGQPAASGGILKTSPQPRRGGATPVVQSNVNPNKARAKGKNRGQRGRQQRSPDPSRAKPAMRSGSKLTVGARMSTFFGLGDPTGGMYGDEMRLGGHRTNDSDEGVNVQHGIPAKLLRNNSQGEQQFGKQKVTVPDRDLVRGVEQGMAAYFKFVKREKAHMKKIKPRRSMFEGTINPSARDRTSSLRRGSLTGNTTMMKISEKTMIREELMSLPEFKPVFIRLISLIQFLLMAAMVLYSLLELQFGKFGITNVGETCSLDTGNCPVKFNDDPDIGAVSVELFNPWMGPNTNFLIQFNAKYSPCMREDTAITQRLRQQRQEECGSRVTYANGAPAFNELCVEQFQGHSCCMYYPGQEDEASVTLTRGERGLVFTNTSDALRQAGSRYGMMPLKSCQAVDGALWIQDNTITTGNNANMLCDIPDLDPVNVVLKPCCLGTRGTCQLLTKSQCDFRAGISHPNKQLCSDIACLAETCTTKIESSYLEGETLEVKPHPEDNELVVHDQWQRFLAPIFLHSGAIHFFIMVVIQLYIGSPIERSIGFLRIMLIYMISGIGGYLVSGIFDPYVVSVGSNPAVFGLLGVVLVELLQTWKVVPGAIYKLLKIMGVILIAVLVGSLPFVDNHAQLGGLVFGMLSACIFLPYISLGKWHERGRKIILFIAAPLLFVLIITTLVTFYAVQDTEWCTWCGDFNCWEWHSTLSCDGDVANV